MHEQVVSHAVELCVLQVGWEVCAGPDERLGFDVVCAELVAGCILFGCIFGDIGEIDARFELFCALEEEEQEAVVDGHLLDRRGVFGCEYPG